MKPIDIIEKILDALDVPIGIFLGAAIVYYLLNLL